MAQVSSFSQYNCTLSDLNPAYIANIDKNHINLITRNQWPGNAQQISMTSFSINKFLWNHNSSIGLASNIIDFNQGKSSSKSVGLEYGFRLKFLESFVLAFGARASVNDLNIDINNFQYQYNPKANLIQSNPNLVNSQTIKLSYGLILQEIPHSFYFGISLRDQPLYTFNSSNENVNIKRNKTMSFQAMKRFLLTRKCAIFLFMNYESVGKITTVFPTETYVIQPSYSNLLGQFNIFQTNFGILGIGYKYFSKNYGSFNFRYGYVFGKERNLTIGYCYEPKPYIQYDKIRVFSSHEAFIKFKLPAK